MRHSPRSAWSARGPPQRRSSRSEEHTSELQSQSNLVCRLLLEKKKKKSDIDIICKNTIVVIHFIFIPVKTFSTNILQLLSFYYTHHYLRLYLFERRSIFDLSNV